LYSIIEIGGLQQKVEPGDRIRIPYRKAETGTKIKIDRVLLVNNGKDVKVGNPTVSGSSVVAQVLNQGKDKKITGKRQKNHNLQEKKKKKISEKSRSQAAFHRNRDPGS
jgi:large subunit ribosomal protein L21